MLHQEDLESPRISQPDFITILRMALGFIIIWRGVNFIHNSSQLQSLIEQTDVGAFSDNAHVLAFIIAYLTLLCGFFIFVGLFTRVSAIILIPVLIVAVFFVNIRYMRSNLSEFILSLVALLSLVFFAFRNSGHFSADEYFGRGAEMDRQ